ncbi:MAG: tetratricopeptide repeat protein [Methanoregula sp.]|jgi:tetratricopeptide (TPR) repeat protein|uniref:tetratricopeptide repeat protein n=1 Tax=Methanoregula sp. TaxID=2052170 RepID=UPI003D1017AA
MAFIGAILTGYNIARENWWEGMNKLRQIDILQFEKRFRKTLDNPIVGFLNFLLLPYGLMTFFYFIIYLYHNFTEVPYYTWMLFFLTIATISYPIFELFLIPEYRKAAKDGFMFGYFMGDLETAKFYWVGYGSKSAELKKYEEAIKFYNRALEIDPKFIFALGLKGDAFYLSEKYEDALKCYKQIIEINPAEAKAWQSRGLTQSQINKFEESIQSFDKALELNPKYTIAWNNRGKSLEQLQRYDDAIASYDKALEIDPSYTTARNNRDILFTKMKRKKT